jgi:pantothenate kinase
MYRTFARADWAELRANTPLMLTQEHLTALRGINEQVSLEELADIYLPLSRLLNLHVRAARNLNGVTDTFLGRPIGGRLADVKAGRPEVAAPVYSHLAYDIVPDEWHVVRRPDVLIFEGLNITTRTWDWTRRATPDDGSGRRSTR